MNGETRYLGTLAIWGWPLVLGILTAVGLIAALFSDGGFGDLLAAACLGIPAGICILYGWFGAAPDRAP